MEDTLTAPVVESNVGETTPKEAPQTTQVVPEQQTTTVPQVEVDANKPQANDTERRKASDFYREREKLRRLEQTNQDILRQNREMLAAIQELKNPKPSVSPEQPFDKEKFWNDPDAILTAREQKLQAEIRELKEAFNGIQTRDSQAQAQKRVQEAVEMLFPKSSPDSTETLKQRVEKDPEYAQMVQELLQTPAFNSLASVDPKEAAELALLKIEKMRPKPQASPKAISKGLMGGIAAGNPAGDAKANASLEGLMSEFKKLTEEANNKLELRFNPEHKAKRDALAKRIEKLIEEKRK